MKIIVNKYTIYKKVWISYHHLIKAEFEHCFWNILEFGFIWIACDCMFVLFSLSHPCVVYLKSKEANQLSLHALVSSERSVMVKKSSFRSYKPLWIPEASFWNWKWKLSDCPTCSLTNKIKSIWKIQAYSEETRSYVSRLNPSSLEENSFLAIQRFFSGWSFIWFALLCYWGMPHLDFNTGEN